MSHRPALARLARALPIALVTASVAVPAAHAADAPKRLINIGTNGRIGEIADTNGVVGIAADGSEVILNQFDAQDSTATVSKPSRIVVRNVALGKTTVLSDYNETALAASDDLQRILFITERQLSPDDKNTTRDLYLYDRPTKITQLVSRESTGGPAVGVLGFANTRALSGDGNSVLVNISPQKYPAPAQKLVRYDVNTGTLTTLASDATLDDRPTNRTGSVAVTNQGIFVGTRKLDLPATLFKRSDVSTQITPDGRKVILFNDDGASDLRNYVVDTVASTATPIPLVGPLAGQFISFLGINPAGTEGLTQAYGDGGGLRKVKLTTGASELYGGAIPENSLLSRGVSPGWGFYADTKYLAQIGTTPIPGGTVQPARPATTEYLQFDQGCRANPATGKPARRPSLTLIDAGGVYTEYSWPPPVRADVLVRNDRTGLYSNVFLLKTLYERHTLNAGWGPFTVTAKVSFADGTKGNVKVSVRAYTPPLCF